MVKNNGGGQCKRCVGSLQALGRDPLQVGAPAEEILWEWHGEQTVPKVRNIDDALEGGQNAASGSQHTHIPTDLDLWINQVRMAQELCPNDEIKQFASDFVGL